MSWNCTEIEERLSDFLEGALTAEERREFSGHAATCANCAALVKQVGGVLRQMQGLEGVEPPPQLIPQILERTLGPRAARLPRKASRGWMEWLRVIWQPRFAVGALSVATAAAMFFYAAGVGASRAKKTAWNPIEVVRSVNRSAHLTYARGVKFVNDLRVVYEIQSRLRPESSPAQQSTPPAAPAGGEPQQKSMGKPQSGPGRHGQSRASLLAFLLNDSRGRKL